MVDFYEIVVVEVGPDDGRSGYVAGKSDGEHLAVALFHTGLVTTFEIGAVRPTGYRVDPKSVSSGDVLNVEVDPTGHGRIKG